MTNKKQEIISHIAVVNKIGLILCKAIKRAIIKHDASKLTEPELPVFSSQSAGEYGTDEYFESMANIKPAIEHHYQNNSHHPEHYENGVSGMTLIDIVEMYCDWRSRSETECEFLKNLEISQERFGLSDQLVEIFQNTERVIASKNKTQKGLRRQPPVKGKKCKSCK